MISFSSVHRVDVASQCSVDNIVKTVIVFKQVDEMESHGASHLQQPPMRGSSGIFRTPWT